MLLSGTADRCITGLSACTNGDAGCSIVGGVVRPAAMLGGGGGERGVPGFGLPGARGGRCKSLGALGAGPDDPAGLRGWVVIVTIF